jgi:hypothetical protein
VDEEMRVCAGRNREVQKAAAGTRKLFRGKLRKEFLEWLAATANCAWSARKVGIDHRTVWKHRMHDPVFAEEFDRALDQGLARLKAGLIQEAAPIVVDGDREAPGPFDPALALRIVHEYRSMAGVAAGQGRKRGRAPRVATNAEVKAALLKGLKALGVRVSEAGEPGEAAAEAPEA